jgi:Kef-type K+ transport system membrane component KefB
MTALPLASALTPGTFLAIVATSALAGTIASMAAGRGILLPVVVVELFAGVILGPQVIGLEVTPFIEFFSALGLGLLFFFAGYEIRLARISGRPLTLGIVGWLMSLAIAYTVGGVLAATGVVLSLLYTGSALSTTAIGTLIPVLRDSGDLETRFGRYLLAAGAIGELGPILLLTLILSTQGTVHNALILVAFVALAVAIAVFAVRSAERTVPMMERTLESSAQLAVRWIVVLVFALALLAFELGLDLLLGGFAAGAITQQVLGARELPGFESKLTAIAFGVFVPFFFVTSGMSLDVTALFASGSGVAKMLVFLALFLLVRGTPALVLYRGVLDGRERAALALMSSTQLPLVLAITALAQNSGHMRASTAAALVGAAALSTLIFPALGLRLRGDIPAGRLERRFALAEAAGTLERPERGPG